MTTQIRNSGQVNLLRSDFQERLGWLLIQDQKESGSGGGAFTSGSWQIRDLNTIVYNNLGASLNSNQITLPRGAYLVRASTPGFDVDYHVCRLQNISDTVTSISGNGAFASTDQTLSLLKGVIYLTSSKVFELQHQAQTTNANGFGVASTFTVDYEVFSSIYFLKIAD